MTPAWSAITHQLLPNTAHALLQQNWTEMLIEAEQEAILDPVDVISETGTSYPSAAHDYWQRLLAVDTSILNLVIPDLNGENMELDDRLDSQILHDLVFYQGRISTLPEFGLYHYFRAKRHIKNHNNIIAMTLHQGEYANLLQSLDLRQIAHVLKQADYTSDPEWLVAECFLQGQILPMITVFKAEQIWPFFADNPIFLDEILGVVPKQYTNKLNPANLQQKALQILQCFPLVPPPYVPKLLEWALFNGKSWKHDAQSILLKVDGAHQAAITALASKQVGIRYAAVKWLTQCLQPDSIAPLYLALSHEKQDGIRGQILSALWLLGEDLHDYFQPDALLIHAQQALKKCSFDDLQWLNPEAIPSLTWQNQQAVHAQIVYYWLVHAIQCQNPAGNAFLHQCIALLSTTSQQQLAQFVLTAFVAEDLKLPTAQEALDYAKRHAPSQWQDYQDLYNENPKTHEHYGQYTLAQVINELQSTRMTEHVQDALPYCGILALCSGMNAQCSVLIIKQYLQQQPYRSKQIKALFTAMAQSNDDSVVQFLLTQHHHSVVPNLLSHIAKRRGLSPKKLADACIPHTIAQPYLPIFRQEQSHHLFQSMCAQTRWSMPDWQQYYFNHPLMPSLISRLVWMNTDSNGHVLQCFRPNMDGNLVNLHHHVITLSPDSQIQLAHSLYLTPAMAMQWQQHFDDHTIVPLFDQFSHHSLAITHARQGRLIEDYRGWQIDSHVVKHILLAQNYQACQMEQAYFYAKYFPDANLHALIYLSHPHENDHAAVFLYDLCFQKPCHESHPILLKNVPPIILAQAYADYRALGEQSLGFVPDYPRKRW